MVILIPRYLFHMAPRLVAGDAGAAVAHALVGKRDRTSWIEGGSKEARSTEPSPDPTSAHMIFLSHPVPVAQRQGYPRSIGLIWSTGARGWLRQSISRNNSIPNNSPTPNFNFVL